MHLHLLQGHVCGIFLGHLALLFTSIYEEWGIMVVFITGVISFYTDFLESLYEIMGAAASITGMLLFCVILLLFMNALVSNCIWNYDLYCL